MRPDDNIRDNLAQIFDDFAVKNDLRVAYVNKQLNAKNKSDLHFYFEVRPISNDDETFRNNSYLGMIIIHISVKAGTGTRIAEEWADRVWALYPRQIDINTKIINKEQGAWFSEDKSTMTLPLIFTYKGVANEL